MLLFQGKSPYSSFRHKKLLQLIQNRQPAITNMRAYSLYLVQSSGLLQDEQDTLLNIIDKGAASYISIAKDKVFVTPRFGTVSPWSSKATDIINVCGVDNVERIEKGILFQFDAEGEYDLKVILPLLHDKMTETCSLTEEELIGVFKRQDSSPTEKVRLLTEGTKALEKTNTALGLALSEKEIAYLVAQYRLLERNPTYAELMMFAQINSEHCRHKIFNACWTIDDVAQEKSLFGMIRHTFTCANDGVLSAYKDNGAIIQGHDSQQFFIGQDGVYHYHYEPAHIVIKVETHNHPTAIAPFEGAATGAGGEIRDEGATGIGAKPKAGLVGFSVSNLHIPNLAQPWEQHVGYPSHIASSLDIILQGPIGAASFNNEFGRPTICGYFRTFETPAQYAENEIQVRGYHKPMMIAGGLGQIRPMAVQKSTIPADAKLVVLGGPAMLIGLGGGAASSMFSGGSQAELDFASVQRSNPEMQRRCQEVISCCFSLGEQNPIISIHDVGAGGLSNALSELVHDSDKGAVFDLRAIPSADTSLNAMEIWCNEAQERYVLAIDESHLPLFERIAKRERCPFAVVGTVEIEPKITVVDPQFNEAPVALPLSLLFGEGSRLHCDIKQNASFPKHGQETLNINLPLSSLIERVLQLPVVADKRFLITIGDRTVTGLVTRDQLVGPWQVAVADVGVTTSGYQEYFGEAIAMGERAPVALLNARAAASMAVGEAITNIVAADVQKLSDIKLSANWMAAFQYEREAENLFNAVEEIALHLCPALGICIPVGKDSLSMQMKWQIEGQKYNVAAPLSLVISAFAPVADTRKTLTPELVNDADTELLLLDLGFGRQRLGASSLAQVTRQLGSDVPQLDSADCLIRFFNVIKSLRDQELILAYHDRSDGGLITTLCEMMFASHLGITLHLTTSDLIAFLFNEELGAVLQFARKDKDKVNTILDQYGLQQAAMVIGTINKEDALVIKQDRKEVYREMRVHLHRVWSETSYHLQALRDNPDCAKQEFDSLLDTSNPGLNVSKNILLPTTSPAIIGVKPQVAILREQGVNGHMEMAAAFERAGFQAKDIHMTDILSGAVELDAFQGLVACGGFSYGDVLGAGRGWANSIIYNPKAREKFEAFFNRPSIFVLGVCNGCQMLSSLKDLIPGASGWPKFVRNISEQFEARLSLVKVNASPSLFFNGLENSVLPIVISHGEGRASFDNESEAKAMIDENLVPLQYVDNYHAVTEVYPANPNGSPLGIAAVTNKDGRFTIMMPHAERVFRNAQFSWRPREWQSEHSPWLQLFLNAKNWLQ